MDGIAHLVDDPALQVNVPVPEAANYIYIDLEATHLSRKQAEVCQIAGRCNTNEYNAYIVSSRGIPQAATDVTGLTVTNGKMFLNDQPVQTTPLKTAWTNFLTFVKSQGEHPVLLAHNGIRSDFPIIIREMNKHGLLADFTSAVKGTADTLPIFKEDLKRQRVKQSFSQSKLAELFKIPNPDAHNAIGDVRLLQKLVAASNISGNVLLKNSKPVSWVITNENRLVMKPIHQATLQCLKPTVSTNMINKIADCGMSLKTLQEAYQKGGKDSILMLLGEDGGKPRITKHKSTVNTVTEAVAEMLLNKNSGK